MLTDLSVQAAADYHAGILPQFPEDPQYMTHYREAALRDEGLAMDNPLDLTDLDDWF